MEKTRVKIELISLDKYYSLMYKIIQNSPTISPVSIKDGISVISAKVDHNTETLVIGPNVPNILKSLYYDQLITCEKFTSPNAISMSASYRPVNRGFQKSLFKNDSVDNTLPLSMISDIQDCEDRVMGIDVQLNVKNCTNDEFIDLRESIKALIADINNNGDICFPEESIDTKDVQDDNEAKLPMIEVLRNYVDYV